MRVIMTVLITFLAFSTSDAALSQETEARLFLNAEFLDVSNILLHKGKGSFERNSPTWGRFFIRDAMRVIPGRNIILQLRRKTSCEEGRPESFYEPSHCGQEETITLRLPETIKKPYKGLKINVNKNALGTFYRGPTGGSGFNIQFGFLERFTIKVLKVSKKKVMLQLAVSFRNIDVDAGIVSSEWNCVKHIENFEWDHLKTKS